MERGVGGPAGLALRNPRLWGFVEARSKRFASLQRRSGRTGNPVVLAARSVSLAIDGALAALPLSLIAGAFDRWFLLGCFVPVVLFYAPELSLRDAAAKRRESVERELPFFSVLVGVLGGAGVPLYSIMEDVARSDVFPGIRQDALLVRRDVGIFGMNPNEAFERLAADHPSKRFADFLLGYTSKVRSGGDVPAFLSAESGSLLRELEESWVRYAARVGIVGSMMVTVFGVVPLLLMVVGVFSPASSLFGLALFTGVGVPLLTLALIYMTGRMQPAGEERYTGRPVAGVLLAAPAVLGGALTGAWWLGGALALFAFFVGYGSPVRKQIAETRETEVGLSKFLRELLDYKRQEYDLSKAIIAIEADGGFGGPFGSALAKVVARLKSGVPLDEVRVEGRSRVEKLTFLVLGAMSHSGGGTVDTVFQVSSFADRVIQMRKSAAAEMKPYLFLSYVSPLLLAFGVSFVGGVLSTFGQRLQPGLHYVGAPFHLSSPPPGVSGVADVLIVVSAAALGLIGAKITDFTVKNTLGGAVNVALAIGAVVVMGALGSHSLAGLIPR